MPRKISDSLRGKLDALRKDKAIYEVLKLASSTFLARVVGIFLSFLLTILITRKIGPDAYGFYSILIAWLVPLATFSGMGTDKFLLKRIPVLRALSDTIGQWSIYKKTKRITLLLSVATALLVYLASHRFSPYVYRAEFAYLLLVAIPVYAQLALNSFLLKALNKQVLGITFEALLPIAITLILVLAGSKFSDSPALVLHCYLIGITTSYVASLIYVRRSRFFTDPPTGFGTSSAPHWIEIVKSSYPLYTTSMVTTLIASVDVVILSWYMTPSKVAVYTVALSVVRLVAFPLSGMVHVIAPKYSEAYSRRDIALLKRLHFSATKMTVLATLPIIGAITIFPVELLSLFGAAFKGETHLLYILLVGQLVNVLAGPIGYLMWMTDLEHALQKLMLYVLATNILLNLILIPKYGATGAAVSYAAAMLFKNIAASVLVKRKLGFYGIYIPLIKESKCSL